MRAPKIPLDTLEEFYEATKVACDEAKNEVCLWKDNRVRADYIAIIDKVESKARKAVAGPKRVHEAPSCESFQDVVKLIVRFLNPFMPPASPGRTLQKIRAGVQSVSFLQLFILIS